MILVTILWYQETEQRLHICFEEVKTRQESKLVQSHNLPCYTTEQVKREEKEILKRHHNLSLYTVHLPPSNHSSCSDVPFKSHLMFLHTISTTVINTTTPHHPMSQHLRPLPYHNKLYSHHHITISYRLCDSQCIHLSVTQFLPHPLRIFAITLKYFHTFQASIFISFQHCDRIAARAWFYSLLGTM